MARQTPASRTRNLLLTGAAFVVLFTGAAAFGETFHRGGVGACQVCHIMHDSEDGLPVMTGGVGGYSSLLRHGSPSDVCLSCHAFDNGQVMGDTPLAPPAEMGGGNFVFLLEDNLNDAAGGLIYPVSGDHAGHNIRARSHNLSTQAGLSTSPGGNFPANTMRCTSCHDPHGNTNYRMLRGVGPTPGGSFRFRYPAPEAAGIPLDGPPESGGNHNAYLGGMSLWCANCHGDYLSDDHNRTVSPFEHPTNTVLGTDEIAQYNRYAGTGNPTGGSLATAYLPEVPFEDPFGTTSSTLGPSASSRLTCLSCHRAHASSSPAAGRWDFRVDRLGDDGAVSGSWALPNPYGDPDQDPLCFKCHETVVP